MRTRITLLIDEKLLERARELSGVKREQFLYTPSGGADLRRGRNGPRRARRYTGKTRDHPAPQVREG